VGCRTSAAKASLLVGDAFASNGGAAFGDNSSASGLDSAAIGERHREPRQFSHVRQRRDLHSGQSASVRHCQQHYSMSGIASDQSKAVIGSPTHIVASNVSGDLAAYTFAELGLVDPTDLNNFATKGDIAGLQSQINHLGKRDSQLTEGLAAVVALAQPTILPGQRFAMRAGWGGYDDANAIGLSAVGVLAQNVLRPGFGTVALDGGLGFGTSEGEVVGRAGLSFGWFGEKAASLGDG
jgi:hypothetical protein